MRFLLSFLLTLVLAVAANAQEPLTLELDHTLEISRDGNSAKFCAHSALDAKSRTVGLMFQEELPEQAGMIFDFRTNDIVQMWMKNTILPLDMVFIDKDLKVANIVRNTKPFSLDIISSEVPVRYVLEVNAGISDKFNILIGDTVSYKGSDCKLSLQ